MSTGILSSLDVLDSVGAPREINGGSSRFDEPIHSISNSGIQTRSTAQPVGTSRGDVYNVEDVNMQGSMLTMWN